MNSDPAAPEAPRRDEIARALLQQRAGNRSYHGAYDFIQKYGAALTDLLAEAPPLERLITKWRENAEMLAEGNKSEGVDPAVGMQRACADQLEAALKAEGEARRLEVEKAGERELVKALYGIRSPDGDGHPQSAGGITGEAERLPDEAQAMNAARAVGSSRAEVKRDAAGSEPAESHQPKIGEARRCVPLDWQPIDTAPKNAWILVTGCNTSPLVLVAGYREEQQLWQSPGRWVAYGHVAVARPTHWMPLPAAPLVRSSAPPQLELQENKDDKTMSRLQSGATIRDDRIHADPSTGDK